MGLLKQQTTKILYAVLSSHHINVAKMLPYASAYVWVNTVLQMWPRMCREMIDTSTTQSLAQTTRTQTSLYDKSRKSV